MARTYAVFHASPPSFLASDALVCALLPLLCPLSTRPACPLVLPTASFRPCCLVTRLAPILPLGVIKAATDRRPVDQRVPQADIVQRASHVTWSRSMTHAFRPEPAALILAASSMAGRRRVAEHAHGRLKGGMQFRMSVPVVSTCAVAGNSSFLKFLRVMS